MTSSRSTALEPATRRHQALWVAVALVAAVAVAVRLYALDSVSLWTDELFTRFYPQMGLAYLWTEGLRTEPTSPLYYTLIAALEPVFGQGAAVLRLPSVLGSVASVALAGLLGRELFGRAGAGLLGALLLALAPMNVFLAQDARSYALQGAALALALLGLARVLRGAPGLLLYAIGATGAIWLHPSAIAAVGAINLAALAGAALRLLDRPRLLRWLATTALVFLLCLPLLPGLLSPTGAAATSWIPALSRWSLERVIGTALAGPGQDQAALRIAELAVPALALLLLLPPWRRPTPRAMLVLAVVPLATLAAMIAISLGKPVLLNRTVAWMLVPLAVALGGVLSARWLGFAAAPVAAAGFALALQLAQIDTLKEDWRGFLAALPDLQPPALVVLAPHTPPAALAVYAPGARPVRLDDGGPPVPETTIMAPLFGIKTISPADLAAAIAAGRPVWLLYRRPEYEWVQRVIVSLPPPTATRLSPPGPNPAMTALSWQGLSVH